MGTYGKCKPRLLAVFPLTSLIRDLGVDGLNVARRRRLAGARKGRVDEALERGRELGHDFSFCCECLCCHCPLRRGDLVL